MLMPLKMHHIVSLSGGSASAVAADRVLNRYDFNDVTLWFADTKWEDEDLYRFLDDLESRWEKKIVKFTDGRTPLEVAEDRKLIPNSWAAPVRMNLNKFLLEISSKLTTNLSPFISDLIGLKNIDTQNQKKFTNQLME